MDLNRLAPFYTFLIAFFVLWSHGSASVGQSLAEDLALRIVTVEEEEAVYIYHTGLLPLGYGFNVYRKSLEEQEFQLLNPEPLRGALSGDELRAALGALYTEVESVLGQPGPNATLARLRSDLLSANVLSFVYPQIALALGRLYVDRTAPLNGAVMYRVELVDEANEPTGITVEESEILIPVTPAPPTLLRATNSDRTVTLHWQYPVPTFTEDDKVVRFDVYRIDPLSNQPERINQEVILRNNAVFEYAVRYTASSAGQTEQFYVTAIDIAGQESDPSAILRFKVEDLTPPAPIAGVAAELLPEQKVRLTWPATDTEDLLGYHVYRSHELFLDATSEPINPAPLEPSESFYIDTFPSESEGHILYYHVTALDLSNNESAPGNAAMVLPRSSVPPPAPINPSVIQDSSGTARITWINPSPLDSLKYVITRIRKGPYSSGLEVRLHEEAIDSTSFLDRGEAGSNFLEGNWYAYRIRSVNTAGLMSTFSEIIYKTQDTTAPTPPSGLYVQHEHASRALLTWNPSASTDIMQYIVYRKSATEQSLEAIALPSNIRFFEDFELQHGIMYTYWITAADSAGNESGRSASISFALRDPYPPQTVRNLRLVAGADNHVNLYWEPVPSADLAGYRVYRSNEPNGVFELLHENLVSEPRWLDSLPVAGSWYRIHAVDHSGNESLPSVPVSLSEMMQASLEEQE